MAPGVAHAAARDLAGLRPATLTFDQSVLNQETFGIYRDSFDELQTRPFNLLFSNIGRHPNLTPWEGQEGQYTRYVNALIGNNGRSNIDNGVDAIQGAYVGRAGVKTSWGLSAAFLAGNDGSADSNAVSTFSDIDDVSGFDLRLAGARQLSERYVLGAGVRFIAASSELTDTSFESGVGGFIGTETFDQSGALIDVGVRSFRDNSRSWDIQAVMGFSSFDQLEASDNLDDTGAITARLVTRNYEVSDITFGVSGGINWQKPERIGETEVRAGYERLQRELDNDDLSFSETGTGITPITTLLNQDAIVTDRVFLSAKSVFAAGETEMFMGGEISYGTLSGATQLDASGVIANEAIDDSDLGLGLILGVRQPLYRDKLRLIVSGRADAIDFDQSTQFDTGTDGESGRQTLTSYAIAIEGVLSNVTFDLAWLSGEEAAVDPVDLGVPSGSRRIVRVDRLVVSAAVSW